MTSNAITITDLCFTRDFTGRAKNIKNSTKFGPQYNCSSSRLNYNDKIAE